MLRRQRQHSISWSRTIDGKDQGLGQYKGRVVMVLSTCQQCGFTPQYERLQKLYTTYKDRGFVILGFPPMIPLAGAWDQRRIRQFCTLNYGVTFPMCAKITVKG